MWKPEEDAYEQLIQLFKDSKSSNNFVQQDVYTVSIKNNTNK